MRVCDSIFTQMVVVGDTVSTYGAGIHPHLDDKDVITCIVTLGDVTEGGSTVYYSGLKEKKIGKVQTVVPFQHGRIQIGNYSEVVHGVSKWRGNCITLNFNIKHQIVKHFRDHSDYYYSQWVESGFQKMNFLAK